MREVRKTKAAMRKAVGKIELPSQGPAGRRMWSYELLFHE
jgi:hypothetical protein